MNQIKQKIKEIGLSQREISKRLGKNASYLAGVFRTGLSTAKQNELMDDLEIVASGGTILSDEELLELVDDQLEKSYAQNEVLKAKLLLAQEGNAQLRAESDKYFNETQVLDTEICRVNRENNMLCGDFQKLKRDTAKLLDKNRAELSIKQKQLNCANSLADVRGKFLDQCNKERWKYQDKYAYHFKLNFILILVIVIGLILWVLK